MTFPEENLLSIPIGKEHDLGSEIYIETPIRRGKNVKARLSIPDRGKVIKGIDVKLIAKEYAIIDRNNSESHEVIKLRAYPKIR